MLVISFSNILPVYVCRSTWRRGAWPCLTPPCGPGWLTGYTPSGVNPGGPGAQKKVPHLFTFTSFICTCVHTFIMLINIIFYPSLSFFHFSHISFFIFFFHFCVLYSMLFDLPALRFLCWHRTQDCCYICIVSQTCQKWQSIFRPDSAKYYQI